MPALGTHDAMTKEECLEFFGENVPFSAIITHNWRTDVVNLGEAPAEFVSDVSGGLFNHAIEFEINKRILDTSYDLIISIGQVIPHEIAGIAGYSKNLFVGCGGSDMINKSHMLAAVYGMERTIGKDFSPVRKVFDFGEENLIRQIPLIYVLTVTAQMPNCADAILGLYIGRSRKLFELAVKQSQKKNLTFVDEPLKKIIVYLGEKEFKSTWLGNKAIYRTRMAIADGGELIVIAPGIKKFGEDLQNDELMRKYGYIGRDKIISLSGENEDLRKNSAAAACLILGSTEGRFSVTYAPGHLSREEIEGVNYEYMPICEALKRYDPNRLREGHNVLPNGEKLFYINNPALGLWVDKQRFGGV